MSHEMLLSTLNFMWPMHQQSLMLLHSIVKEKMHVQEKNIILSSALYIMWPMHIWSLKLLCQKV